MMTDRHVMVQALADAAVEEFKGAAPIGSAFDKAAARYNALEDDLLEMLYAKLKTIDAETGYEISVIDSDYDFTLRG